jgi:hypothetical protein
VTILCRYQWTLAWCFYIAYLVGVVQYFEVTRGVS